MLVNCLKLTLLWCLSLSPMAHYTDWKPWNQEQHSNSCCLPWSYRGFQLRPPYCPWDCAIDLLPGSSPPHSRLQLQKKKSNGGICQRSSRPVASGFVSTEMPCVVYRGLNARYSLPPVSSAPDQERRLKIFLKLYLHSANHLIFIWEGNEWKL